MTIDDREDHSWSYYQPSSKLPDGYPDYLHSPDPRDVKITYKGGSVSGASAVAISALSGESENVMVYYLTLEKTVTGLSGDYPYTVISNPFSKRPKNGNTYYGFAGWKVVSGGKYISEYSDGQTMYLDATIHFTGLEEDKTAEVELEAQWTEATVKTGSSNPGFTDGTYETNFWVLENNTGRYGTPANINGITVPANVTVSARYPDGEIHYTARITGNITAGGDNAKMEFVNMNSTGNVNANGYTFTMGRGIVNSNNGGQLRGCTSDKSCVHTVKVESGTYASLMHFTAGIASNRNVNQLFILGCDYDRAKNDNGKLTIRGDMYVAQGNINLNRASGSLYVRSIVKSGNFQSTVNASGNYSGSGGDQSYYFSVANTHNAGRRSLVVEGGHLRGIAGGMDETNNQGTAARAFDLRVRGTAQIDGVVYGAAEFAGARGTRTMVFTGGTVNGWIAGGANGTQESGGALNGATYLYVGGTAKVNSGASTQVMNRGVGGNVFGAGCGYGSSSSSGQVQLGTNVVVADKAEIERGVYGGGSYGYTTATANIFILGGQVEGVKGGVNGTAYDANISGGVFGGACQNQGGTVSILMNGGTVEGGVYGGSNQTGTLSGTATLHIDGGTVGTEAVAANVHGGGYGKDTRVNGNVSVTLGTCGAESGATVYGDVYGGSALGRIGTATGTTNNHSVTLNQGVIYGSLYGGGLGDKAANIEATVNGNVKVAVTGGSVRLRSDDKEEDAEGEKGSGSVFGCNNQAGAPTGKVSVDIYGTGKPQDGEQYALHAVYGGGNQANYTTGTPTVTVHGCSALINYVYGGGNAADVRGTDVTVWGCEKIGWVFGGGNGHSKSNNHDNSSGDHYNPGANITADGTNVTIHGGTIERVFGGSNQYGYINSTITVTVKEEAEGGKDPICGNDYGECEMNVTELYGGGNEAKIITSGGAYLDQPDLVLDCSSKIGSLFGGARKADYGKDINLTVTGGTFDNVFGGNNLGGTITGNVHVTVQAGQIGSVFGGCNINGTITGSVTVDIDSAQFEGCSTPFKVDNVYGGGNEAPYGTAGQAYPQVNIKHGHVGRNVFGGGLGNGAMVTGNPTVTIGGTNGSKGTADDEHVGVIGGNVYGGGNEANVDGSTSVYMLAGKVGGKEASTTDETGCIYGGGRGKEGNDQKSLDTAKVSGDTHVTLRGGEVMGSVYGGGHKGKVGGNTNVKLE